MNRTLIISNRALPLMASGAATGAEEMPKRIHIVPRGELFNKAANVTQVLDEQALDSILADLREVKAKNGGLYMGEEHFIYNADMRSEAFAWAKEFEKDDQGIWATAYDATDVGQSAIKNKRYKWTSFVADAEVPGAVQQLGNGKVRILKIDTVGFTNYANGKSLLTPITNRFGKIMNGDVAGHEFHGNQWTETVSGGKDWETLKHPKGHAQVEFMDTQRGPRFHGTVWSKKGNREDFMHEDLHKVKGWAASRLDAEDFHKSAPALLAKNRSPNFPGADASADEPTNNQVKNRMKNIATKLGLAAEASEDAILAEVTKILNRATTAEEQVTPLKNRVTALETENQTLLGEQIDADFATVKITDEKIINRHKPLLSDPKHFKNRAERIAFIADLVKPAAGTQPRQVLLNRNDGKTPAAGAAVTVTPQLINAEVRKLMNRDGIKDFTAGYNALCAERPELFAKP